MKKGKEISKVVCEIDIRNEIIRVVKTGNENSFTMEEIDEDLDQKILDFLREVEKAGSGEISRNVCANRSTVSRHLQYLKRQGLIEEVIEKGHYVWTLTRKK